MPKPTHQSSALVLFADHGLCYEHDQLPAIKGVLIDQLARVRELERESAARAILCGISLHRVKASMPRGKFVVWINDQVEGAAQRQCYYYMKLATAFVEKAKVTAADLRSWSRIGAHGAEEIVPLTSDGVQGESLLAKVEAFVGESSLNELLNTHGCKSKALGGAREKPATGSPTVFSAEELRAQKQAELTGWIESGHRLLVTENSLQYLSNEEIRNYYAALKHYTAQWHDHFKSVIEAIPALPDQAEATGNS